jgi:hypothetical protein
MGNPDFKDWKDYNKKNKKFPDLQGKEPNKIAVGNKIPESKPITDFGSDSRLRDIMRMQQVNHQLTEKLLDRMIESDENIDNTMLSYEVMQNGTHKQVTKDFPRPTHPEFHRFNDWNTSMSEVSNLYQKRKDMR